MCWGTLKYSVYVNNLCSLQEPQDSIGREISSISRQNCHHVWQIFSKSSRLI